MSVRASVAHSLLICGIVTLQAPSPSSTHSSSSKTSSIASDLLAPPPVSTIFNRTRAGSAPSPIKVLRDSKDASAYKITVSPQLLETNTPTDEDGGVAQQFPETPNMFSPMLTGDSSEASSMPALAEGAEAPATIPRSATLPRAGGQSFAQALLLNRAGTTGGHARQPSGSRIRPKEPARSRSPSTSAPRLVDIAQVAEQLCEEPVEDLTITSGPNEAAVETSKEECAATAATQSAEEDPTESNRLSVASTRFSRTSSLAPSVSQESDTSGSMYSPSESSTSRRQRTLPPVPPAPSSSPIPVPAVSDSPAPSHASLPIQPSIHQTPTAAIPEPAPIPPAPSLPPAFTAAMLPPATLPHAIPPPPVMPPPSPTPSQKARSTTRGRMPPALTITSAGSPSEHTVAVNGADTDGSSSAQDSATSIPSTTLPNPNALPPQEQSSLTYKAGFIGGRDSDIFRGTSLGSPPPYYQAISDAIAHNDQTPTTGFPGNMTFAFPAASTAAGPANGPATSVDWTAAHTPPLPDLRAPALVRESSIMANQRGRMRPPLPAGPRRPSQATITGFPTHSLRDRSGSVSSVASGSLFGRSTRDAPAMPSPQFQTPAPKWRGYTMEAAKWTFTSSQLQDIVSRAIRQSAEASSIRLLRLEILDHEIPEEKDRLEAQRAELMSRYKSWARRRTALIEALGMYVAGGDEDTAAYAVRMVDDLRDVSAMLDRFAEELHSVDGQIARLDSLVQTHTGSALAMALRKLNTSFLKQVSENQALRNQVQTLEAERDEAWQHAEDAANELDKMESAASSRRSSRISAVRKSSLRVSKAGLRTPSQRLSQLSSHGSAIHPFNVLPRSPLARPQRIPPVPAIPRSRPPDLMTDVATHTSVRVSCSPNRTFLTVFFSSSQHQQATPQPRKPKPSSKRKTSCMRCWASRFRSGCPDGHGRSALCLADRLLPLHLRIILSYTFHGLLIPLGHIGARPCREIRHLLRPTMPWRQM